jgi:hypothetical protein
MRSLKRAIWTVVVSSLLAAGPGVTAGPVAAQVPEREPGLTAPRIALAPLSLPVLSGLGEVGSLLGVTQPTWNLPGVTTTIVWLRDGVPIPGTDDLWSYTPVVADAGHLLSAQVTGTLLGLLPVTLITNALAIAPLPTTPVATTAPTISGEPKVGKLLTGTAPVWDLLGVTTTYEWLRAGTPIPGATSLSYTVVPDDVGKAIALKATGAIGSVIPGTSTSAAVTGLLGDAPTATPPAISGTPKVGQTLTVATPAWSVPGVTTTYQWQRNGSPIPGAVATTYPVAAEDVGAALTVKATGTKTGYTTGTVTTAPVTGLLGDAPTATPPAISGTPKVGQTLTVATPAWSVPGVTTTYQWQRNGSPVGTGPTYQVTPDDVGAAITAQATGTKAGYEPGTVTTAPVTGQPANAIASLVAPAVVGTAVVGRQLVADPGTWDTPGAAFTYQWLRDGVAVPGATSSTYTVRLADATHLLSFTVTATLAGHEPGSATAEGVAVPKVASRTKLSLVTKTVKKGKRATLRIVLTAAAGAAPAGKVKVYDGAKLLKGYSVRTADNGVRIVKLPVLKPGKHKLKGTYVGSSAIAGSTSRTVTLKVLRKR